MIEWAPAFQSDDKPRLPFAYKYAEDSAPSPTEEHVKLPLASIEVAKVFDEQSVGFDASAVAVEEFPVNAPTTVGAVTVPVNVGLASGALSPNADDIEGKFTMSLNFSLFVATPTEST